MGSLKRRTPSAVFEPDHAKRLKRFGRMLLDDRKMEAVFEVDGVRIPVHREVLVASSSVLASFGDNIPVSEVSVEVVRHFRGYLYGFNCFEWDELSIEEALNLADLFIRFEIMAAATAAARFCLQNCSAEHLSNMCRVVEKVKETHSEFAQKIAENLDTVDMGMVEKSTLLIFLASNHSTAVQKLLAVAEWTMANCENTELKKLYQKINIAEAAKSLRDLDERLSRKDEKIKSLQKKLHEEEEHEVELAAKYMRSKKKISALTQTLTDKDKQLAALQSAHNDKVEQLKSQLEWLRQATPYSSEPLRIIGDKTRMPQINRMRGGNTLSTEKYIKKTSTTPLKKRTMGHENKVTPSKHVKKVTRYTQLSNNEEELDFVLPDQENSPHLVADYEQDIESSNVPQINALAEEIRFLADVPRPLSSASNELEERSSNPDNKLIVAENKSITNQSKDEDTEDEVDEDLYHFVENNFNEEAEKKRCVVARPTSCIESANTNDQKEHKNQVPNIPEDSKFGFLVALMRKDWSHPNSTQPESLLFHQVRTIVKIRRMTQTLLAEEACLSKSVVSVYLRGLHKGHTKLVEKKLVAFVRRFIENSNQQIFKSPACAVQRSIKNGNAGAATQIKQEIEIATQE